MRTLLLIMIGLCVVAGCSRTSNNGASSPRIQSQTHSQPQHISPNQPPPPQSQNGNLQGQQASPETTVNARQVADHLEQLATSIPNVQRAHCVVFGKTAIVGIDVPGNLPRASVDNIKYGVAEALRKDPLGANAIVTADIDLDQRLKNIRQNVINGRPIAGFADELGRIIGRIMPQLPRDTNPTSSVPPKT
jgi:YhcN/YlaJ family sporulation lipoprotein